MKKIILFVFILLFISEAYAVQMELETNMTIGVVNSTHILMRDQLNNSYWYNYNASSNMSFAVKRYFNNTFDFDLNDIEDSVEEIVQETEAEIKVKIDELPDPSPCPACPGATCNSQCPQCPACPTLPRYDCPSYNVSYNLTCPESYLFDFGSEGWNRNTVFAIGVIIVLLGLGVYYFFVVKKEKEHVPDEYQEIPESIEEPLQMPAPRKVPYSEDGFDFE